MNTIYRTTKGVVVMLVLACALFSGSGAQDETVQPADQSAAIPDRIIPQFEAVNADIRSVCKQLSEYCGLDVVVSPNVIGKVSLNLSNKTWREILGIVCRVNKLTTIYEKTYIYIMTASEYHQMVIDDANNTNDEEGVEPLQRSIVECKNAQASEMVTAIQSLLSKRGTTTVVERNNAILIYDTDRNIAKVRKLLEKLDVETQQISISCKIIEVSSGAKQAVGVHWSYFSPFDGGSVGVQHLSAQNVISDALEYGVLTAKNFTTVLQYLFQENRGEVVAEPQITTLDNKMARVFMGQMVPVTVLDKAGNTTVQMVDAGSELSVTPHITGEGRVLLDLNPSKKSYTLTNNQPIVSIQSAQTNVVVNDGETVVIAGLTSNDEQNIEGGIPVLKDIPLIGILFKRSEKSLVKKDLIIFVTPHILKKHIDKTVVTP